MFFLTKDGAYKADDFVEFLGALAEHFPQVHDGEVTLVMDNAPIHHASIVRDFYAETGIKHIFLPPYSPDLNPIENVFGLIKARYLGQGVANSREEMVDRILNVIDEINNDPEINMQAFYDRMRLFVEKVRNRESF